MGVGGCAARFPPGTPLPGHPAAVQWVALPWRSLTLPVVCHVDGLCFSAPSPSRVAQLNQKVWRTLYECQFNLLCVCYGSIFIVHICCPTYMHFCQKQYRAGFPGPPSPTHLPLATSLSSTSQGASTCPAILPSCGASYKAKNQHKYEQRLQERSSRCPDSTVELPQECAARISTDHVGIWTGLCLFDVAGVRHCCPACCCPRAPFYGGQ